MGRKYVITGAGGFIGYELANALADDGATVVGVDLRYPDPRGPRGAPRFIAVTGDFRDAFLAKRVLAGGDVLFHLASAHLQVHLPESEYWDVNVHSLPAFLNLAREAGIRRCVHASSVGVYGDVGTVPANERTDTHPQSVYGITKLAGERAALDFGRDSGLEIVVLRPAWVYGAGCPRTARLWRALRARRFLMIGSGRNRRHPLYIADMIEACRLAATVPHAVGRVFVIAGDRAVTTRELVDTVCATLAVPRPSVRVPYPIGAVAAALAETLCRVIDREPPLSRRTLEFFTTNNAFDIEEARTVLGFRPAYSLERGLKAMRPLLEASSSRLG